MVKQGYKQTEIGVIPEDWEVVKLEQAVNFLDNLRRPIKSSERKSGSYPYYGASGVIDYVDSYIFDDELLLLGEDGENILSRNLPLVYYVNEKCWINNHAHVLKCKDIINPFYLLNKLESLDYTHLNSGTAQPKLNKERCRNIQIPLPPLPEQEAIAEAMSDADAWIASLEQLIAKKRLIKQGAMQELLTPPSPSSGNADGEALEPWEVKKLGEVCDVLNNLRIPIKESEREKGDNPYYGANGIQGYVKGYTHDGENVLLAEDGASDLKNYPVNYTIGKIWVNNHAHVLRGKENIIISRFLSYLLKSVDFTNVLVGGTRAKLNKSILENIEIPFPSLSEQTRIATILSDMDAEIKALEQKLSKARQIKQGMMQELLTGRVRLL